MIQLVKPCRGHITQRYGNIQSHDGRKHTGNDYAYYSQGQVTDEVFAAADGVVLYAGDSRDLGWPNGWYLNPDFDRSDAVDSSAGNVVILGHKQGGVLFDTTSSHLAAWSVKAGDTVRARQRIATIGDSGFSAGKHLHFELMFRPFNFDTDTYGRADPNPYFIAGLAAQGSATTTEEDDMFTDKDRANVETTLGKVLTLVGMLDNVAGAVEGTPSAILDKRIPRANSDATTSLALFLSYADADRNATVARIQAAIANTPPPELAAGIVAAGLAEQVRDELVKLLGGGK